MRLRSRAAEGFHFDETIITKRALSLEQKLEPTTQKRDREPPINLSHRAVATAHTHRQTNTQIQTEHQTTIRSPWQTIFISKRIRDG